MTYSDRKWYLHFTRFQQRVYIAIPEVTGLIGDSHDHLTYLRATIGAALYGHVEPGSIVSHLNHIEADAMSYANVIQTLNEIAPSKADL